MPNPWKSIIAAGFVAALAATAPAHAETASPWSDGFNSKSRLIAGTVAKGGGAARTFAGIEIVMTDGWKTYWRSPGDAGGVPPFFDWAGSENLVAAKVLYPAPARLKDASGDSVGYKNSVIFPVEVTPKDPTKPVTLTLAMEFGICREICVPAEAKLTLAIPAGTSPLPTALAATLELVPRKSADRRSGDPEFKAGRASLAGDKPKLEIDAIFGGTGADMFVEAPDGIYLNLPKKTRSAGNVLTFEIDLATGVDVAELKGKTLVVTMVGGGGQSEATWKID